MRIISDPKKQFDNIRLGVSGLLPDNRFLVRRKQDFQSLTNAIQQLPPILHGAMVRGGSDAFRKEIEGVIRADENHCFSGPPGACEQNVFFKLRR